MATAAKFVQPILLFLVYLFQLDVDVVPIKFQQFLFGEKPKFSQIGGLLYFGGHFGFKMATIAKQTMDINSLHHILLGSQISPKSEDFVFWPPLWIQNGRHSKPKWSPYGAACLTPCKYPLPLKSFHF